MGKGTSPAAGVPLPRPATVLVPIVRSPFCAAPSCSAGAAGPIRTGTQMRGAQMPGARVRRTRVCAGSRDGRAVGRGTGSGDLGGLAAGDAQQLVVGGREDG